MHQLQLIGLNLNEFLGHISKMMDDKLANLGKPENSQPEYLSRKEVAKLLDISLPTLNQWTKDGLLPFTKKGNRVYYNREDITLAMATSATHKYKKGGISHE